MREEAQKVMDLCKDFVRSMNRVEDALGGIAMRLEPGERAEIVRDVIAFLDSEEVTGAYTREVARELIAQLSASGLYADFQGSTDAYIQ